jgi:hypothetical protein
MPVVARPLEETQVESGRNRDRRWWWRVCVAHTGKQCRLGVVQQQQQHRRRHQLGRWLMFGCSAV